MTALRIGWASPWNERSAIAHSASDVAFEMAKRGHEVTVLRTEHGPQLQWKPRPAPGTIANLESYSNEALRSSFDVIFAHIGDNYDYHGAIVSRIRDVAMVGIFHDPFLVNLAFRAAGNEAGLRTLIRDVYGDAAWGGNEPLFDRQEALMQRCPMLEWLARQTVGAVAHSHHYEARLREACPGPVAVIPLAYCVEDLPPPPASWDRILVCVIGHANSNKRIDQLIMAIGASPFLRSFCRIRIIGEASDVEKERLRSLAQMARIAEMEFTGWVTDDELRWRLRDVDVISCLRNPVLEGASASLIVAMMSGRPTLVTWHGCYAEVPADAVMACSPSSEALDIMLHLERLLKEPAYGKTFGQKAIDFTTTRHSPSAYVDRLLPLATDAIAFQPRFSAQRRLTGTLDGFGLPADDPSMKRVSDVFASLLENRDQH